MAEKKTADAGDDKKPEKSNSMLYILLGVGGVVLLSCCCCGGGGGAYLYHAAHSTPAFVGNWDSQSKEKGEPEITLKIIENGKGQYLRANAVPQDFKWKTVDSKSVQFDMDNQAKTFWVGTSRPIFNYAVEGDTLTLITTTDKRTMRFQKVAGKK